MSSACIFRAEALLSGAGSRWSDWSGVSEWGEGARKGRKSERNYGGGQKKVEDVTGRQNLAKQRGVAGSGGGAEGRELILP